MTCLIVSPISWVHHMVWVVPAILWLALAPDRPRWGRPFAVATAVLFWSAPVWWVPYKNTSDLHLDPLQLVAGNSFFFAMLLFLAGAAVLVVRRGALQTEKDFGCHDSDVNGRRTERSLLSHRGASTLLSVRCSSSSRIALLARRPGRPDSTNEGGVTGRSPGGFVTPPSQCPTDSGLESRDHPRTETPVTEHLFVSPLEERWGPGGGARGTSRPGPHPHARPRGFCPRKLAENQLRAKGGRPVALGGTSVRCIGSRRDGGL